MRNIASYKDALYWTGKAHSAERGKPMGNYCSLVRKDDGTIELVDTGYKWDGKRPRHMHARIHPDNEVELFYYNERPNNRSHNIFQCVFELDVVRIGKGKYVVWDNRGFGSHQRWNFPTQWAAYGKKMPLLSHGTRYNLLRREVVNGHHEVRVTDTDRACAWKEAVRKFGRAYRVMAKVGAVEQAWEQVVAEFCEAKMNNTDVWRASEIWIRTEELYNIILSGNPQPHLGRIAFSLANYIHSGSKLHEPEHVFQRLYNRHTDELRRMAGCFEVQKQALGQEPMKIAA